VPNAANLRETPPGQIGQWHSDAEPLDQRQFDFRLPSHRSGEADLQGVAGSYSVGGGACCLQLGFLRRLLLRGWVNSRFPGLALSFTEWQHRGNEGERSRLRLTVEVRTYRHGLPRTHTY
jgi:hypothetical protein